MNPVKFRFYAYYPGTGRKERSRWMTFTKARRYFKKWTRRRPMALSIIETDGPKYVDVARQRLDAK